MFGMVLKISFQIVTRVYNGCKLEKMLIKSNEIEYVVRDLCKQIHHCLVMELCSFIAHLFHSYVFDSTEII